MAPNASDTGQSTHAPHGPALSAANQQALRFEFERACNDGIAAGASSMALYGTRVWFIEHTPKLRAGAALEPLPSQSIGMILQFVRGSEFRSRIYCVEAPGLSYCFGVCVSE